jgi:hypothetical protein
MAVNASVFAALIAFTLCSIFQCIPIQFNWDRAIKDGHCFNSPVWWYTHAAWNTAFDIIVLALPIPVISSLHMKTRQKIGLIGVFVLGAL